MYQVDDLYWEVRVRGFKKLMHDIETDLIVKTLEIYHFNITDAAKHLRLNRTTLSERWRHIRRSRKELAEKKREETHAAQ